MSPEKVAQFDQALAGVDQLMREMVSEVKSQLTEGYKEHDIMTGLHDYLTNYTTHTRAEFATLYMRAVIKLAKSDDRI